MFRNATFKISALPPERFRHLFGMSDDDLDTAGVAEAFVRRLANPETADLHVHFAKYGCYPARVDRA